MTHLQKAYYWLTAPPYVLPPYTTAKEAFRRFQFETGRYNKLGMYHDDILWEYPDVKEALRRLPLEKHDERNFRIMRAVQLDIQQIFLPKHEWTKYEDNMKYGYYLQPYLEDVRREMKEMDKWTAEHV